MSVRKLPDNKVTKDGRAYAFYINEYGLDGKRHQHQSKAYMTYEEAVQAEKDYINITDNIKTGISAIEIFTKPLLKFVSTSSLSVALFI